MSFTARIKDTKEVVNILDYEYPKNDLTGKTLISPYPDCDVEMIIVHGHSVVRHFRHKGYYETDYHYSDGGGESMHHLMAKKELLDGYKKSRKYSDCKFFTEYPVKAIKRIIDLAIIFPDQSIMAIEVQLSKISIKELNERTNDYDKEGIEVIWYFGHKNHNDKEIQEWAARRYGKIYGVEFGGLC